jgi:hypothetical protein
MQLLTVVASASAAYAVYSLVATFVKSYQNSTKARSLKCEEPPFQKNRYPFGIDNLLRALAADKAQLFPVDAIQRTIDTGAITFKYSLLGNTNIFTADEKNIQALLATQFSDFGKATLDHI